MSDKIICGKTLNQLQKNIIAAKIQQTRRQYNTNKPPKLTFIKVGDDYASQIYIEAKSRNCSEVGIISEKMLLPHDATQAQVLAAIKQLNNDDSNHGILLQLPLPGHLDTHELLSAIDISKDVDGLTMRNGAMLYQGMIDDDTGFYPCTPKGIITMLKSVCDELTGMNVAIVGRSHLVGRPLALMLLRENCCVTILHSKSRNNDKLARQADIVVACCGVAKIIDRQWIKPGAIVIDVGINRKDNELSGDVDFADVIDIASHISPVPGGVGPMTIASLLDNVAIAYERCAKKL